MIEWPFRQSRTVATITLLAIVTAAGPRNPAVGRQDRYPDRCAPARRRRSPYHFDGATRTSNEYAARSAPWDVAPRLTPFVRPAISQMIRRSRSGAAQGS